MESLSPLFRIRLGYTTSATAEAQNVLVLDLA
jgi:hypothetical protein